MTTNKRINSTTFNLINIMVEFALKYRTLEIIWNCIWHKESNCYHKTSNHFMHSGINNNISHGSHQSPINRKNTAHFATVTMLLNQLSTTFSTTRISRIKVLPPAKC